MRQHVLSSSRPPPYHRRSDHLPRLAEAAAGPEDVILIFVAAPGLVGGGSAASAVLCEGSGRIDITGEEKKGSPKDAAALLSHLQRSPRGKDNNYLEAKYIFLVTTAK